MHKVVARVLRILLRPFAWLLPPDSRLNVHLRGCYLAVANSPPPWMVVAEGGRVVQVGTPNTATLEHYLNVVGRSGSLTVLEADPENARVLVDAVRSRGWDNVNVIAKGAWSTTGTMELQCSPFKGDHKLPVPGVRMDNDSKPENASYKRVRIDVVTLDDVLTTDIDYLCVTVNGAELEVLKGASETLARCKYVFAKGHALSGDGTPINLPISRLLREHGFDVQVTRGESAVGSDPSWSTRAGDVFGQRLGDGGNR